MAGETAYFNEEKGIRFSPPLFHQRYATVEEIILEENSQIKIVKVAEFGCAEISFFKYLKPIKNIQEILEIDIDRLVLIDHIHRIRPFNTDYLNRRSRPLSVKVLSGNIADPDARLIGTDIVVAIEVIEHVYPDALDALPYNIFGFIQPRMAIFTTPNYDFNVLFPNPTSFRHRDHKFEWTREQFKDWANNITTRFPNYNVSIKGIGPGPKGTSDVGCCSQIAVFISKYHLSETYHENISEIYDLKRCNNNFESYGVCTYESCTLSQKCNSDISDIEKEDDNRSKYYKEYYEIIDKTEFPFDERSDTEKILQEVQYQTSSKGTKYGHFFNRDNDRAEIPLSKILPYVEEMCSYSVLRSVLEEANLPLEECILSDGSKELCTIYRFPSPSSSSNNSDFDEDDAIDLQEIEKSVDSDWN